MDDNLRKGMAAEKTEEDGINNDNEIVTFRDLGIVETLCEAIDGVGWKSPTEIQKQSIPEALNGRDIIGLAETGSGKTGLIFSFSFTMTIYFRSFCDPNIASALRESPEIVCRGSCSDPRISFSN